MLNYKNIYKLFRNRIFSTIVLSIIVFLFTYILISGNYFYNIDKSIQNNLYNRINSLNDKKVSKDIIVIKIDSNTLKTLGRFPFKRSVYLTLINNLDDLGVGVIGFDIIFADKTEDSINKNFAKIIKKSGRVVFGTALLSGGFVEKPLKILADSVLTYGYFRPNVDTDTNKVYTFTPKAKLRQGYFNHFTISLLKAYYYHIFNDKSYLTTNGYYDKNYFYLKDNKIPLSREGSNSVLLNYFPNSDYESYSFIDLYDKNSVLYKKLLKNKTLKNKIIIIGTTAKGIKDIFFTPLGITYGIYIHANILNTILTKNYLSYFNKNIELLIIFLLILLSVYSNLSKSSVVLLLSNLAIISIFIVIFPSIIIFNSLFLNYPFELIFTLVLSLLFSNLLKYLLENKNKKILVKALGEYISKDIANSILLNNDNLNFDGINKKISIFFSDIAGFTTISEKMNPEQLVEFLRDYLGEMSNIIMDERGFINKYEGDAIMALFGVFNYESTSSYDNCKSALDQQLKLKILNKDWEKQFGQTLKVRMGLHTGNAIIGNIGAKGRKMEYTALGDSVNLASRLEGVNKFYGTYICASEDVVKEVGDRFEFRKLDKIRVKGKTIAIEIYELLGEKDNISNYKKDIKIGFEKALELYFNKEFKEAGEIFKKLGEIGDPVSLVFSRRCLKFEISGVKEDWDGVWTMEEK